MIDHRNATLESENRLDGREQKVFQAKSEFSHQKMEKEEQIRARYQDINQMKTILAQAKERLAKLEGEKEERLNRVNLKQVHMG